MPDSVLAWGVDVIAWLQHALPGWEPLFALLSRIGDAEVLLVAIPAVYLAVDRRAGLHLFGLALGSIVVNTLLKDLLAQPRPADFDPSVRVLGLASGHGLPSGHTQLAVVVGGYVWWRWPHPILRTLVALLAVGIGVSRIYLGVHFPTDVAGGLVIGVAVLGAAAVVAPYGRRVWSRLPWAGRVALAVIPGLAIIAASPTPEGFALGGAAVGFLGGDVVARRFWRFDPAGRRLSRLVVGLAAATVWMAFAPVGEVLRYGVAAAWVAVGVPLVVRNVEAAETS